MAKTSSKGTTKKKTNTTASKSTKKSAPVDDYFDYEPEIVPYRREFFGFLFVVAAVLLVIALFDSDGILTKYLANILKGIVGQGYWLCIPVFAVAGYTLIFHENKRIMFKVICILLMPVFFGALLYLAVNYTPYFGNDDFVGLVTTLYYQGQDMQYGGVLSGLLGFGLQKLIGPIGAVIFSVVGLLVSMYVGLSGNILDAVTNLGMRAKASRKQPAKAQSVPQQQIIDDIPVKKRITKSNTAQTDIPLGKEQSRISLDLDSRDNKPLKAKPQKKQPEVRIFDEDDDIVEETAHRQPAVKQLEEDEFFDDFLNVKPAAQIAVNTVKPVEQVKPAKIEKTAAEEKPARRTKAVISKTELKHETDEVAAEISKSDNAQQSYVFPPTSLLNIGSGVAGDGRNEILDNKAILESALKSFGVDVQITDIIRGPTVTRYDIKLREGVKLAKITNLSGDLALSLGVVNVRIAPVPDQMSTVGIEVPNKIVSTVYLRELLESDNFTTAKSRLTFAIGKDIGGSCICGNISKLPHMLIAGTTGSGKSVCMNSLILSLLYKARPDEVKLIMIDPKMVELGIYNGIPHLYVPVVTDPKKAAGALQWSVYEMLKRYRRFSELGVRDLAGYNERVEESEKMPHVVIVIDELADLMMIAAKEVEESICRVAQMGRAAGMHLIVATQRPSADVITGLMKANIPSRIAFAVSSTIESRIILDQGGAEKLIGMGDMLYSPVGSGKPKRIQGAFVSDKEREDVINFIKENSDTKGDPNKEILEYMEKSEKESKKGDNSGSKSSKDDSEGDFGDYDDMLPQAVEAVIEAKSCSVSMLQRRLKLGYSRAARIVDQMEELGVVGPYEGAKPRSVVMTREDWKAKEVEMGFISDDFSAAAEMSESIDE